MAEVITRMGAVGTCPCGWSVVSPLGVEDVKKHAMIHMKDVHPETVVTPEELMAYIKQI
jgi:predicted small metal-binding protein